MGRALSTRSCTGQPTPARCPRDNRSATRRCDGRQAAFVMDKTDLQQLRCAICEHEVPLSEAVVPEASDYMAHFCGLECYERWRKQAAAFVNAIR
jgi:hypothetical protein